MVFEELGVAREGEEALHNQLQLLPASVSAEKTEKKTWGRKK
jgi:hypothetical protein